MTITSTTCSESQRLPEAGNGMEHRVGEIWWFRGNEHHPYDDGTNEFGFRMRGYEQREAPGDLGDYIEGV